MVGSIGLPGEASRAVLDCAAKRLLGSVPAGFPAPLSRVEGGSSEPVFVLLVPLGGGGGGGRGGTLLFYPTVFAGT